MEPFARFCQLLVCGQEKVVSLNVVTTQLPLPDVSQIAGLEMTQIARWK